MCKWSDPFSKRVLIGRGLDFVSFRSLLTSFVQFSGCVTQFAPLAQLVEHMLDVHGVTGSSPVPSTIQFVLEPDSLRERVWVRFLFIGGSAEGLLGTVNEQRQGITMIVVSCLLLCGIKFALCELGRPPIWRVWE